MGRVRKASKAPLLAAGAVPILAVCSLLAPWAPSFDPWGWILWGREITHPSLIFSTSGYPPVESQFRGSMAWKLRVPEAFLRGRRPRLYLRRPGHPLPGFPPRHARRLVTVARAGPWSAIRREGRSVGRAGRAGCA